MKCSAMKNSFGKSALLTVFLFSLLMVSPAFAALKAVGPVNPNTGFPIWYQDTSNVAVELCTTPAGVCAADPVIVGNPESERTGFGSENFWWSAVALMNTKKADGTTGRSIIVLAQEAAYLGGDPAPGDQMSFGRLRIFADVPVAGKYKITHPYGTAVFDVSAERIAATNGIRAINANLLGASGFDAAASNNDNLGDIGCAAAPCDFTLALASGIGPFLRGVSATAGTLGDGVTEQTVTGSPFGTNVFRIEGPAGSDMDGAGNNVVETDLFAVSGKIFSGPSVVSVSSTNPDGVYKTDDIILIAMKFIAPVTVNTLGGTPELLLETGAVDKKASYESGSGTDTLVFKYTVNEGDSTNDLDYASTTALALNGGTINDVTLGTPALLGLIAPGSAGSLGANKNIAIDITPPALASSTPADAAAVPSVKTVVLTITDNVAVDTVGTTVTATKDGVALAATDFTRTNGANGLSATITLAITAPANGVYAFTVTPVDTAANIGTASVVTITGNDAIPVVTGVSSPNADGPYGVGKKILITVTLSQAVSVAGNPLLALSNGKDASLESGSGTNTLTFGYTVGTGDSSLDLDYASATALSGNVKNTATSDVAILTLPAPGAAGSLGAVKNIVINTVMPVVSMPTTASLTENSVIITWTTDKPAASVISYGATSAMGSNFQDAALIVTHSLKLSGLSPSTQYFYAVNSCDVAGNCVASDQHTFVTAEAPVQPAPPAPSGAAPATTTTVPDEIEVEIEVPELKDEIKLQHSTADEDDDSVTEINVKLKSAVTDPLVTLKAFETVPVEKPSKPVYQYFDLSSKNFQNADISAAEVEFKVSKEWMSANGIISIKLARYENGWTELDAELVRSTETHNHYKARVNGFSLFAVVGEKAAPVVTQAEQPAPVVQTPAAPVAPTGIGIGLELLGGALAAIAVAGMAIAYKKGMFPGKAKNKKGE